MAVHAKVNRNARPITIEDARLVFRNFEGRVSTYNTNGLRSFSVVLDPETAEVLRADGWNVKERPPREEGDEPFYHMSVAVSYRRIKPQITLISETSGNQVALDEADIHQLDSIEIRTADMVIAPSFWEVGDAAGIKAYLRKLFVVRVEDELDLKYANYGSDADEGDYD